MEGCKGTLIFTSNLDFFCSNCGADRQSMPTQYAPSQNDGAGQTQPPSTNLAKVAASALLAEVTWLGAEVKVVYMYPTETGWVEGEEVPNWRGKH